MMAISIDKTVPFPGDRVAQVGPLVIETPPLAGMQTPLILSRVLKSRPTTNLRYILVSGLLERWGFHSLDAMEKPVGVQHYRCVVIR